MNAKALLAATAVAGVAVLTLIALWPAQATQSASSFDASHANTDWNRAATSNPSTATSPYRTGDADVVDGGNLAGEPDGAVSEGLPPPEARPVTLQDGTVLWAAQRERASSAPARVR